MEQPNHNLNFDSVKSAWVNEPYLPEGEFDLQVEEISRNGYTILENRLNQRDIKYAIKKIDEVYESQIKDCGS